MPTPDSITDYDSTSDTFVPNRPARTEVQPTKLARVAVSSLKEGDTVSPDSCE